MRKAAGWLCACALGGLLLQGAGRAAAQAEKPLIERGRYLIEIGGCNDCHTQGFAQNDAKTPERQWLEGSAVGWAGPRGARATRPICGCLSPA